MILGRIGEYKKNPSLKPLKNAHFLREKQMGIFNPEKVGFEPT